jgi:glycosidase
VTFAGNHDVTRLASQLGDTGHLAAALAVLFTAPGLPCVYYGDELAWRGVKEHRAGGDDAIRPPLPPGGSDGAVPADESQVWAVDLHRRFIALRRARPWLAEADIEVGELANRRITYTVTAPDAGSLVVVIDLDAPTPDPPPGSHPIAADRHVAICEPA